LIPGSKEISCRLTERVVKNSGEKKKKKKTILNIHAKKSCKGTLAKL
jgi:hypothetical protein